MQLVPEAQKQYQDLVAKGRCSVPVGDEEEPKDEEQTVEAARQDARQEIIAKTATFISCKS